MALATGEDACRCGHERGAHEHYRRGSDCALCACPRFFAASSAGAGLLLRLPRRPRRAAY